MKRRFLPALTVILILAGCDLFGPEETGGILTVMTQNVYLGADLDPILTASSLNDVPGLVAQAYLQLQQTDFASRADAIADLIEEQMPDVIGLQEVISVYAQDPGDYLSGNPLQATTVAIDFGVVLTAELASRGLPYSVVASTTDFDVEMPAATSPTTLIDLRIVDHEIILAKDSIPTSNPTGGTFLLKFQLPIGGTGPTVEVLRGWASVDVEVGGKTVRFVSTHLEVEQPVPLVQQSQASELLQILGAGSDPIILVGDFNAPAAGGGNAVYMSIAADGFTDAWVAAGGAGDGLTCCQNPSLNNASSQLATRIDLIFTKGSFDHDSIELVGEATADRTTGGLWPSDHAGLVAVLRVR